MTVNQSNTDGTCVGVTQAAASSSGKRQHPAALYCSFFVYVCVCVLFFFFFSSFSLGVCLPHSFDVDQDWDRNPIDTGSGGGIETVVQHRALNPLDNNGWGRNGQREERGSRPTCSND